MVWPALVAAAPYIASAVGTIGGALLQSNASRSNTDDAIRAGENATAVQYARNMNMYKNRYKWMTQDMRRAGLNPILAASGGFNPGSSPSVSPSQVFQAQPPSMNIDFGSTAKDVAQAALSQEQAQTEGSKRNLMGAQAAEAIAKEAQARANAGLASTQEKVAVKNIGKVMAEIDKIKQEAGTSEALQKVYQMEKEKIDLLKKQLQNELKKIEKMSKVYSNFGGQLIAYINALFGQGRISAPTISIVKGLR